jgi:hypothetical protein
MVEGVLKYGGASTSDVKAAQANFPHAGFNAPSFCCTPIEILSNDGKDSVLHTASGFFWLHKGRPYLVTNWHVVSGRNPFTGALGPNAFVPEKLAFYGIEVATKNGLVVFERRRWVVNFSQGMLDILATPPEVAGKAVDVWCMPIASGIALAKDPTRLNFSGAQDLTSFVNELGTAPVLTMAGDDCMILGYPLNNADGLRPPIWKRGSIASDTNLGVGGKPIFLVDAAVTAAMSGSPIFRRVVTMTVQNRDLGAIQEITAFNFIGVYAGRLQNSLLQATNLGYAWYSTLIDPVAAQYGYSPVEASPDPLANL